MNAYGGEGACRPCHPQPTVTEPKLRIYMLNINGRDNLWRFGEEAPNDGDVYILQETRTPVSAREWMKGFTCYWAHGQEEPGVDGRVTQTGGVLVAVKSRLRQTGLWLIEDRVQTVGVRIYHNKDEVTIAGAYAPPGAAHKELLLKQLHELGERHRLHARRWLIGADWKALWEGDVALQGFATAFGGSKVDWEQANTFLWKP